MKQRYWNRALWISVWIALFLCTSSVYAAVDPGRPPSSRGSGTPPSSSAPPTSTSPASPTGSGSSGSGSTSSTTSAGTNALAGTSDVQNASPEEQTFTLPDINGLNLLGTTSIPVLIGRFLQILIGVVGSIALAVFIYGGALWMTDRGNADRVEKAKELLVWGALGVIVILSSYAIVNFLFNVL